MLRHDAVYIELATLRPNQQPNSTRSEHHARRRKLWQADETHHMPPMNAAKAVSCDPQASPTQAGGLLRPCGHQPCRRDVRLLLPRSLAMRCEAYLFKCPDRRNAVRHYMSSMLCACSTAFHLFNRSDPAGANVCPERRPDGARATPNCAREEDCIEVKAKTTVRECKATTSAD